MHKNNDMKTMGSHKGWGHIKAHFQRLADMMKIAPK